MSAPIAWLRWLVSDSDLYTSWMTVSDRPAASLWKPRIFFHTSSAFAPLTMLVAEIAPGLTSGFISGEPVPTTVFTCLLYTSDAADERSSVDLGGRRIIKKKKK